MMKKYYVDDICMSDIIQIEETLYGLYRDTIFRFQNSFSLYGCDIKIFECWTTDDSDNAIDIRPRFERKYVYWLCYEVYYEGKLIVYDDENSPLTRNYAVLEISKAIHRRKSKVAVKIFTDTEDVVEELLEDLRKIERVLFMNTESDKST